MTDYNDGNWHGWNGGECPVHPNSRVTIKWSCNGVEATAQAASFTLWLGNEICAFRVTKPYREPRTMWSVGAHLHESPELAAAFITDVDRANPGKGYADSLKIVKMVEVLEE